MLVESEDDDFACHLDLLDPSELRVSKKQPASRWLDQNDKWSIHCFLRNGALLFSRRSGISFAILDLGTLTISSTWDGMYQSNDFQASLNQETIIVEQSIKRPD